MTRFLFFMLCSIWLCSCSSDDENGNDSQRSWSDTIVVASHRYTSSADNIRLAFYLKKHQGHDNWLMMGERLTGLDLQDGYEYVLAVTGSYKTASKGDDRRYAVYQVERVLSMEQKESAVSQIYTPFTGTVNSDGSVRDTIILASHHYTVRNHAEEAGRFLLAKPLSRGTWCPFSVLMENFAHEYGYEYELIVDSRPISTGYADYYSVACNVVAVARKELKETEVPNSYVRCDD